MIIRIGSFLAAVLCLFLLRMVTAGGIATATASLAVALLAPGWLIERPLGLNLLGTSGAMARRAAVSLGMLALPALVAYLMALSFSALGFVFLLIGCLLAAAPVDKKSRGALQVERLAPIIGLAVAAIVLLYEPILIPDSFWNAGLIGKMAAAGKAVDGAHVAAAVHRDPIYAFNTWSLLLGWVTWFSGCDPVQTLVAAHVVLAPIIFSAIDGMLVAINPRPLFRTAGLAFFGGFTVWQDGLWLFFTSENWMVVTHFLLMPVLLDLTARKSEHRASLVLAAGLCLLAAFSIHPISFGWELLMLLAIAVSEKLYGSSAVARRTLYSIAAGILLCLPHLIVRLPDLTIRSEIFIEPIFLENVAGWSIIRPSQIFNPDYHVAYRSADENRGFYLAATLVLLWIFPRLRSERWARWGLSLSLLTPLIAFNPLLTGFLSDWFTSHVIRRISQTFPVWILLAGGFTLIFDMWGTARRTSAALLAAIMILVMSWTGEKSMLREVLALPNRDLAVEFRRPNVIRGPYLPVEFHLDPIEQWPLVDAMRRVGRGRTILCDRAVYFSALGYTTHAQYAMWEPYSTYEEIDTAKEKRMFRDAVFSGKIPAGNLAEELRARRIDLIAGETRTLPPVIPGLETVYRDSRYALMVVAR